MMCEVMPTISEDTLNQRGSQNGSEDANFEQLMVNMLDERDKLMETLRETQETLSVTEEKMQEVAHERDLLQRQLNSALPQGTAEMEIDQQGMQMYNKQLMVFTEERSNYPVLCA